MKPQKVRAKNLNGKEENAKSVKRSKRKPGSGKMES